MMNPPGFRMKGGTGFHKSDQAEGRYRVTATMTLWRSTGLARKQTGPTIQALQLDPCKSTATGLSACLTVGL